MRTHLLDDFARSHHGLVTFAAARRVGISSSAWYRALEAEEIEGLHPGVARLPGTPRTTAQAIAAAILAVAGGAMASHRSALALHGVPRPPTDLIDVLVKERSRRAILTGVVLHRPRDAGAVRPVRRRGIPCTPVPRSVCDIAAIEPDAVPGVVGHVLSNRLVTHDRLETAVAALARRGRKGVERVRSALEAWRIDGKPADSVLELAMGEVRTTYHLPQMTFHATVAGYEVDFLVAGTNIVLECDGWATHGLDRDQFEYDRVRRADLTAAGFVVVEFTYRQLTAQSTAVVRRIRALLATWAPDLAG